MTARIYISGFIQGVGYRQFVKRIAYETGLTGWVKNLPDGRVEVLLSGDQKIIEKTIEKFWEGPFLSEVKNVDVEWSENSHSSLNTFEIR